MPLSTKQKAILGVLATEAYALQDKLGLVALPPEVAARGITARRDYFRHGVVQEALEGTRSPAATSGSLRDARQVDYLRIKHQLELLAGHSAAALATAQRQQTTAGTSPNAAAYLRSIRSAAAGAGLTEGYITSIATARYGPTPLEQLSEWQLKKLMFTIRNRVSAKDGAGDSSTRNKSQRANRAGARTTHDTPPSETWVG